ncbi:MAG: LapA family protein [Thermodesulfobacteriota bacterium]|nr:LapA family protein [Thermodesulfobacteriota bacterium]
MKWVKTLLIMIIFILVILFSLQNREEVGLRFGLYPIQDRFWEVPKLPLFLIILCSVFLGVLIGGIGDLYQRFQLKKSLRQNEKMIERLSTEVETLRSSGIEQPAYHKRDV